MAAIRPCTACWIHLLSNSSGGWKWKCSRAGQTSIGNRGSREITRAFLLYFQFLSGARRSRFDNSNGSLSTFCHFKRVRTYAWGTCQRASLLPRDRVLSSWPNSHQPYSALPLPSFYSWFLLNTILWQGTNIWVLLRSKSAFRRFPWIKWGVETYRALGISPATVCIFCDCILIFEPISVHRNLL